jgi:CBS domain containing-hemolysin-like protein
VLGLIFTFLLWLASFLLIGFFSSSETAIVRLDGLTVRHLTNQHLKGAMVVERLLRDKQQLLSVLLIGTNISMVLSTVLATVLMRDVQIAGISGTSISTWLMVVLILLFGEIIPKKWATRHAEVWALRVARPLQIVYAVFKPFAALLVQVPRLLSRRSKGTNDELTVDEESIITMVDMGEEGGGVLETEHDMIVGVLEANHTQIRDVMVPRVDMLAVAVDDPVQEVLEQVTASGFSRIPVYEDTVDNIVGVLYLKDLLEHWSSRERINIQQIMRGVYFVPETKKTNELLRELKRLHIHMAIVVDEYGGTAGLVTIEDLLEEIVGEIQDEYDADEEPEIVELEEGSWLVDGRLPIDEISELLAQELPDDEVDTIGGLAYLELGRIPSAGETVELPKYGLRLVVAETNRRRITKVRIDRIVQEETAEPQGA